MTHNHGVCNIAAVQTAPPFEIHLATHIQHIHEVISYHAASTPLASHVVFPPVNVISHRYPERVASCPSPPQPIPLLLTARSILILFKETLVICAIFLALVDEPGLCCTASSFASCMVFLNPLIAFPIPSPNCSNLPTPKMKMMKTMIRISSSSIHPHEPNRHDFRPIRTTHWSLSSTSMLQPCGYLTETRRLPCSITLPIDVLASHRM